LRRYYGQRDLHFITTSCYRRKPLLGTARARDIFLEVLELVRRRYGFDVIGFVVMPEHIHLLISEPEKGDPSIVMQVLKQTVARRLLRQRRKKNIPQMELWKSRSGPEPFWQRRFYDFNVFSEAKTVEKIQYMHHNPAKRGLVTMPELWKWSSYRVYAFGEHGPVKMDWLFPPYAMRQGNGRNFAQPNEDNAEIVSAHPSKTAKSAAPTFRYRNRKPKA